MSYQGCLGKSVGSTKKAESTRDNNDLKCIWPQSNWDSAKEYLVVNLREVVKSVLLSSLVGVMFEWDPMGTQKYLDSVARIATSTRAQCGAM